MSYPGDSRAYVLLGDAGVGKSVMAGALAQRMRKAGRLGAAYFCRHNDGTRNDPRHLLGTIACQLCYCNNFCKYNTLVGGKYGVRMMLANSKLGVQELFTKLLEEPLGKCTPCQQRKLVIIDALDETEYESREDFLDLVKERFPRLPKWLVFFITSRPEHTVQSRLEKYNPCVRICAGNSEQVTSFYKHHEQDIQRFLENRVDFSRLPYSVKDITKKCNGLFLYAFYIVKVLNDPVHSGKIDQLSDLFPGDIDDFFRKNFKRLYDKVGKDIFKKLFGCAIAAPSPLPVAIIGYIVEREKSSQDEQEVIDVVSQFVVLRSSDRSLTFLHNLIPMWLTNKGKAGKLFIDKTVAGQYLSKIFTEILSVAGNAPLQPLTTLDKKLEDYVSRVAVRYLCRHGDKDSLKLVSSCLTSFYFLEQRVQSGRIEIYHLLEDLKLAAGCYGFEDTHKQKILQEISLAFESNFPVLLECPHLLRSCLLNSSSVVREHVLIPQVSGPSLELEVCDLPSIENLLDVKYFGTTSDKKTVAGVKGRSILPVDASTLKIVGGPFEVSEDTIPIITHLESSPDDKWLFFGRLDKWFSVERGCVEDFVQFSRNVLVYKWGSLTPDGQYIVVKRVPQNYVFSPNGKLIACQREDQIELHSLVAESGHESRIMFEQDSAFTVLFSFSADSTLLLFCIQSNIDKPHFYVWDVHNKIMVASFRSPVLLTVDFFCLSADKRKLILCGEYEIEIWEYDQQPRRLLARTGVERSYVKFSKCAVSLDNELLICCIANKIILFSMRAPDVHSSKRVLRGHLGKIESCEILRVNRYLISYGVDGMVFLWDLIETKAIGFARITQGKESIVSMAVSPEEDRAVCLTSSDRICEIKLCKLEGDLSSTFLTVEVKDKVAATGPRLQLAEEIATSKIPIPSTEVDEFSSSDSEEDIFYYHLEYDDVEESD